MAATRVGAGAPLRRTACARCARRRQPGRLGQHYTLSPGTAQSGHRWSAGCRRRRRRARARCAWCSRRRARTASTALLLVGGLQRDHRQQVVVVQLQADPRRAPVEADRPDHLPRQVVPADDVTDPDPRASATTRGRVNSRMPRAPSSTPSTDHRDLVAALEDCRAASPVGARSARCRPRRTPPAGRPPPTSRPRGCGAAQADQLGSLTRPVCHRRSSTRRTARRATSPTRACGRDGRAADCGFGAGTW